MLAHTDFNHRPALLLLQLQNYTVFLAAGHSSLHSSNSVGILAAQFSLLHIKTLGKMLIVPPVEYHSFCLHVNRNPSKAPHSSGS